MKTLHTAIVLAFALVLASTAACTTDEPEVEVQDFEAVELVDRIGNHTTRLMDPEGPVEVDGSMCECTTQECMDQYVRDNFGCGRCVDVLCADGGHVGGCVLCDE